MFKTPRKTSERKCIHFQIVGTHNIELETGRIALRRNAPSFNLMVFANFCSAYAECHERRFTFTVTLQVYAKCSLTHLEVKNTSSTQAETVLKIEFNTLRKT